MTPSLPALIERLESAKEGSRELDALIGYAAGLKRWQIEDDKSAFCAPFSTSLDAALPDEEIEIVSRQRQKIGDPPKWCAVDSKGKEAGYGYSEALARRIAALKARLNPRARLSLSPPQHDKAKA